MEALLVGLAKSISYGKKEENRYDPHYLLYCMNWLFVLL